MIRVVVTGAKGQLSNCLEDVFREESRFFTEFLTISDLDITDLNAVENYFNKNIFDFFINCAAFTAVDNAESESDLARKINAEGVRNLALSCKSQNAIFIQISTDFVFDGDQLTPYTEEDTPNPISVYGQTKLEGERNLQKITNQYYIIRTSWLYSEYGHNFFKTMLRLAKEKKELNIINDQIGSPTYAKDLAGFIIKIIDVQKSTDFGVYNYSNDGECSWYDFACAIFQVANIKIKVNPISTNDYLTPAKRPKYSVLNKQKCDVDLPFWKNSLKLCYDNYIKKQ